ncbi:DUF4129 domain-containing protein [Clostridium swellfunianum]|uniref:DUF4129 domain-containing protein n=1 Tax=Clostridium swellfunianum TaxID=1367462 RepID=UPI00202E7894|nr:DUF4129 domain-containing protein [Clostridium swellfunianum]
MKLLSLMIPSKDKFDDAVHGILNRTEYAHLKNPIKDFIKDIKDNLSNALQKWFKKKLLNMDNPAKVSDTLSTVFMIIGILAIMAIIVIIIVKINKTFERKKRVKEILGEKIDHRTTPATLRQKALSFKNTGDLRQAVRFEFIALLLLMHEKNLVYLDETKTNEEIFKYLRKSNFDRADVFKRISDIFNQTWYGHRLADEESYNQWSEGVELLWKKVIEYEG